MGSLIVIQHTVADFTFWKAAFDSDPLGRARSGVTGHAIYRATDDPNSLVIHLEFASAEDAEKYLPMLEQLWNKVGDRMGFGEAPHVQARIVEEVERVKY